VTAVVLYFQVHQPFRLRRYTWFDIGREDRYFDDAENARLMRRVAERCYLPATALLARAVARTDGEFRCAVSVSGTALEQMERWAPRALDAFRALVATGAVEPLAETSHHSLAFLADPVEFRAQVEVHRDRVERLLGRRPTAFRNTELVFDDRVARAAEEMGFDVLLGEGADHLVGWRSPYAVYTPAGCRRLRLLLRCYRLSDDIAFRFSARDWAEWPLSPEKFAGWLQRVPEDAASVGLFMDFETAGEHQAEASGIFRFLEELPAAVAAYPRFRFLTPTEAAASCPSAGTLSSPRPVSWADAERDLSAWLGNDLQRSAHGALWSLAGAVRAAAAAGHVRVLEDWRRLTTSDHLYYMATKWFTDGDVHRYFSPYATPHDAYITFMNVLDDLARRAGSLAGDRAEPAGVPGGP